MMSVEQSVEWELAGKIEVLGGNLPQCHFVLHKSEPATNRLSYGTASLLATG
jgi:hypothetical protein